MGSSAGMRAEDDSAKVSGACAAVFDPKRNSFSDDARGQGSRGAGKQLGDEEATAGWAATMCSAP